MTADRVELEDRVAALERGLAAAVERIERLEREVLPRAVPDYDDAEDQEDHDYVVNTRTGERYRVETVPGDYRTAP